MFQILFSSGAHNFFQRARPTQQFEFPFGKVVSYDRTHIALNHFTYKLKLGFSLLLIFGGGKLCSGP